MNRARALLAAAVAVASITVLTSSALTIACDDRAKADGGQPTAAAVTDRLGLYHWSTDRAAQPAGVDRLTWGTDAAAALGTRTVRVALTARDDYGVNGTAVTLATIADQPAYRRLFADPRLGTYLLTTYSAGDLRDPWRDGLDPTERWATHAETAALAAHLLLTYPTKSFVLLNWEGDNALRDVPAGHVAWTGYLDWVNARAGGVDTARRVLGRNAVSSALEFNLVRHHDGAPCDTGGRPCVASVVAPHAAVDAFAYSAWQSLDPGTVPTDQVGDQLAADLTTAHELIRTGQPDTTRSAVLIGELGAPRDAVGECDAATRVGAAADAALAWGVGYVVAWQTFDNDPTLGESWLRYGAYRRDGSLSLTGQALQDRFAARPTSTSTDCPLIHGVVDGRTWQPTLHRGAVISVFGSNLASGSGSTVLVRQGSRTVVVGAGSPWWYASPSQVNATLPPEVVAGSAVVSVRRADGRESNSQVVNVAP